jgi:hypothetical protein
LRYRSLLTPENIEACVRRIKTEEGGRNCDDLIKTLRDLMTKLDIKMPDNNVEDNKLKSNFSSDKCEIVIHRKDKKIQTSFSCHPDSDLSDIFIAIRVNLLDLDDYSRKFKYSFEEYCKIYKLSTDDSSSKSRYRQKVKNAETLSEMFSELELGSLPTTSTFNDDLDELVELDDIYEYNRLCELSNTVKYYDKLLSQYGYDARKEIWDTRNFPITQTDKQMDGIRADIQSANKSIDEYNDFLEYLAEKYHVDEISKCLFLPPAKKKK